MQRNHVCLEINHTGDRKLAPPHTPRPHHVHPCDRYPSSPPSSLRPTSNKCVVHIRLAIRSRSACLLTPLCNPSPSLSSLSATPSSLSAALALLSCNPPPQPLSSSATLPSPHPSARHGPTWIRRVAAYLPWLLVGERVLEGLLLLLLLSGGPKG